MDVLERLARLWNVMDAFEELLRPIRYLSEVAPIIDAANELRYRISEAERRFRDNAPRQ